MYNYVFFSDGFKELDRLFYLDIENEYNVKIIKKDTIFNSKILFSLYKLHWAHRINSKINLPFKSLWNPFLFSDNFNEKKQLCFVFTGGWYYPHYFKYLKQEYPNSKFVYYFSDTIEAKKRVISDLDITYLKNNFDSVLSYNNADAKKYGLNISSIYYSKVPEKWCRELPSYNEVDVLFIGAARNRLPEIQKAYYKLSSAGLKCFFYVKTDTSNQQEYSDGIIYSSKAMPFTEFLGRTLSADTILEIVDPKTEGCTLRFWDAIMYNKKIITNYKYTKNSEFYNPNFMHYFSDVDQIDPSFVKYNNEVQYCYKGENSPVNFIKKIESYLSEVK